MTERNSIQLEIICVDFPDPATYPDLFLGLIERKDVVQEFALPAVYEQGKVTFTTVVEAVQDEGGETVKFYGPAAQGTPNERFVYLSWRRQTSQGYELTSRIKLQFAVFSSAQVAKAIKENHPLRLQVRVRDSQGRPAAASLKQDSLQALG